jgi:hypothetical protein
MLGRGKAMLPNFHRFGHSFYLKEHTSLQRKKFENINPANLPVNLLSTSSVISQVITIPQKEKMHLTF